MKEVVDHTHERIQHMKRWREISEFGPWVLIGMAAVAVVAIGYTLAVLVPRDHVSGEAAALIIFALALFAAAPPMLLLRERTLKGIDQWMPGGKAESASDGDEGGGDTDDDSSADEATTKEA